MRFAWFTVAATLVALLAAHWRHVGRRPQPPRNPMVRDRWWEGE